MSSGICTRIISRWPAWWTSNNTTSDSNISGFGDNFAPVWTENYKKLYMTEHGLWYEWWTLLTVEKFYQVQKIISMYKFTITTAPKTDKYEIMDHNWANVHWLTFQPCRFIHSQYVYYKQLSTSNTASTNTSFVFIISMHNLRCFIFNWCWSIILIVFFFLSLFLCKVWL